MKSPRNHSKSLGLTLVELLIAIGIIAVLIVLATAGGGRIRQGAQATICMGNMRQLSRTVLEYGADHRGDLLPVIFFHDVTQRTGDPWYYKLHEEGYLPSSQWNRMEKSIMRCPTRELVPIYWLNGTVQGLHYGLNEYPGFRNVVIPDITPPKKLVALEASKVVMFGEISAQYAIYPRSRDFRINPHRGGSNLVYLDGHAEFFPTPLPIVPTGVSSGAQSLPFY